MVGGLLFLLCLPYAARWNRHAMHRCDNLQHLPRCLGPSCRCTVHICAGRHSSCNLCGAATPKESTLRLADQKGQRGMASFFRTAIFFLCSEAAHFIGLCGATQGSYICCTGLPFLCSTNSAFDQAFRAQFLLQFATQPEVFRAILSVYSPHLLPCNTSPRAFAFSVENAVCKSL